MSGQTSRTIKVLVADDIERVRDSLIDQLRFEDIEVIGESTLGAAAHTLAERLDVDVVVVAIEEPVARALRTIEALTVGARTWPVVGLSTLGDRETMRKAMVAGARDFLFSPVPGEELRRAILTVHDGEMARRRAAQAETAAGLGTIVTAFGVKGGVGKSVIASNVAVSLAQETKQHVALLDLDLQFGDAAVMLDIVPAYTIEDAVKELDRLDPQLITGYLADHASRVKLLAAPPTPDSAVQISPDQVVQVLEMLAAVHDYVVVDTGAEFSPLTVPALDLATIVLLVVVPEVPCIRRTRAALTLMQQWGYSPDKLKLVVNRTRRQSEVSIAEIEQVLQYPIYAQIPDDRAVAKAISVGAPIAMSGPKSKAGRAIIQMGRNLAGLPEPRRVFGLFRRREVVPGPAASRLYGAPASVPPPVPAPPSGRANHPTAAVAVRRSEPLPAAPYQPPSPAPHHPPESPGDRGWDLARERDNWTALLAMAGAPATGSNGHSVAEHEPDNRRREAAGWLAADRGVEPGAAADYLVYAGQNRRPDATARSGAPVEE